jgi:SAM-dependent methyltransferase
MKLPPLPEAVRAGRLPGWDPAAAERRPCPVCGAADPRPLVTRPDGFIVHGCSCGMIYLADVPGAADLDALYARYGEFKHFTDAPMSAAQMRQAIAADLFLSILERTGGLAGRSLCEIGCASGRFLELARRLGAQVYGVELDEQARAALAQKGIAASAGFPTGRSFDIICAFQTLEHLVRPDDLLTPAAASLAPDGRFLAAVPNGGEADSVGPGWIGFRVDLEHLNYFSRNSLSELLARHGLWVEQTWEHNQPDLPRPRPSTPAGLWSRLLRRHRGLTAPALFSAGRFVLTALARKV